MSIVNINAHYYINIYQLQLPMFLYIMISIGLYGRDVSVLNESIFVNVMFMDLPYFQNLCNLSAKR